MPRLKDFSLVGRDTKNRNDILLKAAIFLPNHFDTRLTIGLFHTAIKSSGKTIEEIFRISEQMKSNCRTQLEIKNRVWQLQYYEGRLFYSLQYLIPEAFSSSTR